ncbi:MAG: SDR family oxidoreductase [Actinomycetota bacterium]|nr:SDR family oxidoreductase [Actinomycetota bacterium]
MELAGKVCVVTGGASGIGRALAERFADEGAAGVVVADLDEVGALRVAAEIGARHRGRAVGVACDVGRAEENALLLDRATAAFGPVDLFCANAGVGVGTDEQTPDDVWEVALDVNLRAHVHAARLLVPDWLERGTGWFLSTASAAGLLTQIGAAPYSVSKHAAVAFAEWLAVTYGDRGIGVSCLCPMGVDTRLLQRGGAGGVAEIAARAVTATGAVLTPEEVADVVVAALGDERFLILPHPEVATFARRRADDPDRWLAGMRQLQAQFA